MNKQKTEEKKVEMESVPIVVFYLKNGQLGVTPTIDINSVDLLRLYGFMEIYTARLKERILHDF